MFTADPLFWQALKVTFTYMIFEVPLKLVVALLVDLALQLREGHLGRRPGYGTHRRHNPRQARCSPSPSPPAAVGYGFLAAHSR